MYSSLEGLLFSVLFLVSFIAIGDCLVNVEWTGTGNWNDKTKWTVPGNTSISVIVSSGTLTIDSKIICNDIIVEGGSLQILNSVTVTVPIMVGAGTLVVSGSATVSNVSLATPGTQCNVTGATVTTLSTASSTVLTLTDATVTTLTLRSGATLTRTSVQMMQVTSSVLATDPVKLQSSNQVKVLTLDGCLTVVSDSNVAQLTMGSTISVLTVVASATLTADNVILTSGSVHGGGTLRVGTLGMTGSTQVVLDQGLTLETTQSCTIETQLVKLDDLTWTMQGNTDWKYGVFSAGESLKQCTIVNEGTIVVSDGSGGLETFSSGKLIGPNTVTLPGILTNKGTIIASSSHFLGLTFSDFNFNNYGNLTGKILVQSPIVLNFFSGSSVIPATLTLNSSVTNPFNVFVGSNVHFDSINLQSTPTEGASLTLDSGASVDTLAIVGTPTKIGPININKFQTYGVTVELQGVVSVNEFSVKDTTVKSNSFALNINSFISLSSTLTLSGTNLTIPRAVDFNITGSAMKLDSSSYLLNDGQLNVLTPSSFVLTADGGSLIINTGVIRNWNQLIITTSSISSVYNVGLFEVIGSAADLTFKVPFCQCANGIIKTIVTPGSQIFNFPSVSFMNTVKMDGDIEINYPSVQAQHDELKQRPIKGRNVLFFQPPLSYAQLATFGSVYIPVEQDYLCWTNSTLILRTAPPDTDCTSGPSLAPQPSACPALLNSLPGYEPLVPRPTSTPTPTTTGSTAPTPTSSGVVPNTTPTPTGPRRLPLPTNSYLSGASSLPVASCLMLVALLMLRGL